MFFEDILEQSCVDRYAISATEIEHILIFGSKKTSKHFFM